MEIRFYTYQEVMDSYKRLLMQSPGKALVISPREVAFLSDSGKVRGASLCHITGLMISDTLFDFISMGDLDEYNFNSKYFTNGTWLGHAVEQTVAVIADPQFIDVAWIRKSPLIADPILAELTEFQLGNIEHILTESKDSDERVLHQFSQYKLTHAQAQQALGYRDRYRTSRYLSGHTPIIKGDKALLFTPGSRQGLSAKAD